MKFPASTLLALCLMAASGSAMAQQPVSEGASRSQNIQTAESGWQVICRPQQPERTKLDCSVIFETYTTNDRVRVASVELIRGDKGRTLIIAVPPGVSLKEGIEWMVDGGNRQILNFASCQTNGCFATLDLDAKGLDLLRKAKSVSTGFSDLQGSRVKVDISLAGFALALAKAEDK